ncbi:hypothetical protein P9D57_17740 [Bacillus sonorensis]|uniref:hypothetical protein n=1 Tax=Bacillus sonorensis TaxID=119858 RepID=UPI002DBA7470|nr:hypothetical protein [Bacillus sonorensis]MEC1440534.1 hypothetical protein [Bacillus sonorensis]
MMEGDKMDYIRELSEKAKRFFDLEYERAFRHFNLTADEIPKRTSFAEDEDGNQVLMIDGEPAIIIYKPNIDFANARAILRSERLYEEKRNEG